MQTAPVINWTNIDPSSLRFLWHSPESNFTRSARELNPWHVFRDYTFKITATSARLRPISDLFTNVTYIALQTPEYNYIRIALSTVLDIYHPWRQLGQGSAQGSCCHQCNKTENRKAMTDWLVNCVWRDFRLRTPNHVDASLGKMTESVCKIIIRWLNAKETKIHC